jgi:hypothetical protein
MSETMFHTHIEPHARVENRRNIKKKEKGNKKGTREEEA